MYGEMSENCTLCTTLVLTDVQTQREGPQCHIALIYLVILNTKVYARTVIQSTFAPLDKVQLHHHLETVTCLSRSH